MSHGPTVCSPSTFLNGFDEGSGRTQSRRVRCESGSQSNFAPQVAEIRPRMECMAGKRCRFSLCQTDDFVFSPEIDQTSACGITLSPKKGHTCSARIAVATILKAQAAAKWSVLTPIWSARGPTNQARVADIGDVCPAVRSASHWFFLRKTDDSIVWGRHKRLKSQSETKNWSRRPLDPG